MLTMHPSLLIGDYDWDPERLPVSEFTQRLAAVDDDMSARGLAGLVVYGDAVDHAALAYLTGFTPKLGAAIAFVAPGGAVRIQARGGAAMLEAAKRLTWVDDVVSGPNAGKAVEEWLDGLGGGAQRRVGLVTGRRAPASGLRLVAAASEGRAALEDASDMLSTLMARKRPLERRLIAATAETLSAAVGAVDAARADGASVVAAIQAGEAEARRRRVADVRTLFSLDGGRVLQPFEGLDETRADPLVAYVAVREAGYWAGGFVTLGERPNAAREAAAAALAALVGAARPGAGWRDLAAAVDAVSGGLTAHAVTEASLGNGIGLNLEEPPLLRSDSDGVLEQDGVYALQAGFADETAGHAILSAIVAVGRDGTEVLWPDIGA